MFIKYDFKFEMFVTVGWSGESKWCILIVKNTVPQVDNSEVKVSILALWYKSNLSFF